MLKTPSEQLFLNHPIYGGSVEGGGGGGCGGDGGGGGGGSGCGGSCGRRGMSSRLSPLQGETEINGEETQKRAMIYHYFHLLLSFLLSPPLPPPPTPPLPPPLSDYEGQKGKYIVSMREKIS